jgi:hypothetical protein
VPPVRAARHRQRVRRVTADACYDAHRMIVLLLAGLVRSSDD